MAIWIPYHEHVPNMFEIGDTNELAALHVNITFSYMWHVCIERSEWFSAKSEPLPLTGSRDPDSLPH